MANRTTTPFVYVDAATATNARRQGMDPQVLEQSAASMLSYVYTALPSVPGSSTPARLFALPAATPSADAKEDRLSTLPFTLLRAIIARLPCKDAARTAALSRRWRALWRCAPLAFADAHLLLAPPTRADTPRLVAAVSRALAAHPGPFRAVHLVCGYLDAHRQELARWVRRLADKGLEELVLVNRPFPLDVPLPASLFDIASLTRLYLGVWKFPDTSALPRGRTAAFPHLRELVLCSMDMESRDLEFLLASSPVLETLGIMGSKKPVRLRLAGHHLRCVQSVAVVDCPNLERLFMWGSMDGSACIRFKIGNAPKLHQLGFLEPGVHMLEIGNTVISPLTNSGIRANPSSMASCVKILGIHVRFGVKNDARMLPTFLRCFPNVETLHIMSAKSTKEVSGKVNLKFWQEAGPIACIQGIKSMTYREFRGEPSEMSFLKFFFLNAKALNNVAVMLSKGRFTSLNEVVSKVMSLIPENLAGRSCTVVVSESQAEGGEVWSFRGGLDLSVTDPFVEVKSLYV